MFPFLFATKAVTKSVCGTVCAVSSKMPIVPYSPIEQLFFGSFFDDFDRKKHYQMKLDMMQNSRDELERQLAAVDASIGKLKAQMERDAAVPV
eukprot:g52721.t1